MTVDLADPGPDGAPGERDTLVSIESVGGSSAPDRLLGGPGPDVLAGGPPASPGAVGDRIDGRGDDFVRGGTGDDVLRGGEGNDGLTSGGGQDLLDAGAGDDSVELPLMTPQTQRLRSLSATTCGAGDDTLSNPPERILVPRGCEGFIVGGIHLTVVGVDRERHRLRLRLRGWDSDMSPPCRVRLGAGRQPVSRPTNDGRSRDLAASYLPRRGGRVLITVAFADRCRAPRYTDSHTLALRLPAVGGEDGRGG